MNNTIILSLNGKANADANANGLTQCQALLERLLRAGIISSDDWFTASEESRREMLSVVNTDTLLAMLVDSELLTQYQAAQTMVGGFDHLMLGNYRLLDRIGAGAMGSVYRGEHAILRRPVAIKVLQNSQNDNNVLLQRFFIEMRALAAIRHPNIVAALDAGMVAKKADAKAPSTYYLVMEYVLGTTLEDIVTNGPMSVAEACELIYQVSGALEETNKHNLVHRDIKPANILITPTGVAKLLDFGLATHFGCRRLTLPGTLLGTLSYMAPEQVTDAASVDIRADIFSLGCTLYFCLTGKPPFSFTGNLNQQIAARLTQSMPGIRVHRSDVPSDLEAIVQRLMAHHRDDRYTTPQSVMRALLPYVNASMDFATALSDQHSVTFVPTELQLASQTCDSPRVLIVDDEPLVRNLIRNFFRKEGITCHEAGDGRECLQLAGNQPFDLILLDIDMPNLSGTETLMRLRQDTCAGNLKIIMMSGGVTGDEMSELLALGADDFLTKPLSRHQLVARAKTALLHKATQDRTDFLHQQLMRVNADLEQTLEMRSSDLTHSRGALIFTLARIVESRTNETSGHLSRITQYVSALGRSARRVSRFASVLDDAFLQTLESCALLHDIGNVALPDSVIRPTHPLDPEEMIILQAHTTIGAETLKSVGKRDRGASAMWQMAIEIARHHHERFDGTGYPDQLSGNDIPLSARIVAIADSYDQLRVARPVGMELSHNAAIEWLLEGCPGHFDPWLLQALPHCAAEFENIFRTCAQESRPA